MVKFQFSLVNPNFCWLNPNVRWIHSYVLNSHLHPHVQRFKPTQCRVSTCQPHPMLCPRHVQKGAVATNHRANLQPFWFVESPWEHHGLVFKKKCLKPPTSACQCSKIWPKLSKFHIIPKSIPVTMVSKVPLLTFCSSWSPRLLVGREAVPQLHHAVGALRCAVLMNIVV